MNLKKCIIVGGLLCWLSLSYDADAQIINSRIGISANAGMGWYHGPEFLAGGDPSLFSYMNFYTGGALSAEYHFGRHIGLGITGSRFTTSKELFSEGYQQSEPDESPYRGSDLHVQYVTPFLQLSFTPELPVLNRTVSFLRIGPSIGTAYADLLYPGEDSRDSFYGIAGKIGFEWPATHTLWLTLGVSHHYQLIESGIYPDASFTGTHLDVGVKLKFIKNKRYIYE